MFYIDCACVCVCKYVYVCVCERDGACMCTHASARVFVYVCMRFSACICTRGRMWCECVCVRARVCARLCVQSPPMCNRLHNIIKEKSILTAQNIPYISLKYAMLNIILHDPVTVSVVLILYIRVQLQL